MPRTRSLAWSELKIGVITIVAIALAAMLIFSLTGSRGFFWERYSLKTRFTNVAGLAPGSPVRVAGVEVGSVTAMAFAGDQVDVTFQVREDYRPLITTGSVARLGSVSLLGERLRPSQWLGLVLGTIGMAMVVAPRALASPASWRAIVLGFIGMVGLAGGTLYFRRFCQNIPLLVATTVQVAAGAILTAALALAFEDMHAVWTFPAVASVVWNVLVVSIGAMALYYAMLTRGTAGRVAANFYLVPGTVAILAWALFGEHLSPPVILGFVITSSGVFLVARGAR